MYSIRFFALLFGIAFLVLGVLGYLPAWVSDGNLFGLFEVSSAHNLTRIIVGVLALLAAMNATCSRLYFQLIALALAIVTIVGFIWLGDLYVIHVTLADNIFHLITAIIALYLGFIFGSTERV